MKNKIIEEINFNANEEKAAHLSRFFKTAKGQYAQGDLFVGLTVPITRSIAKEFYKTTQLSDLTELIKNPCHEVRLCALFIMILQFEKGSEKEKKLIFELYKNNTKYINNWDLVDLSAPQIFGRYIFNSDKELWKLAQKDHLWSQRIAVVSTFYFIRNGEYKPTIDLAQYFLTHKHDLIHKATGWMLREMGKRDLKPLYEFLDKHHKVMPRTMLRYSIEKLSQQERKHYMQK